MLAQGGPDGKRPAVGRHTAGAAGRGPPLRTVV